MVEPQRPISKPALPQPEPSKRELSQAALAWAEYLYDECTLEKHKQLLSSEQNTTIEEKQQGGEG
jgi:hypothetical protein